MQGLRQAVSYVYSATSSLNNTNKMLAIARIRSCNIGQYDGAAAAAVLLHGSSHWQQKNKLRRFSTGDLSSGTSDETAGPRTSVKCFSAMTREAQVVRVSNPAELLLENLEKEALAGSSSDSPTDAVNRLLRWDPLPKLGQLSDRSITLLLRSCSLSLSLSLPLSVFLGFLLSSLPLLEHHCRSRFKQQDVAILLSSFLYWAPVVAIDCALVTILLITESLGVL
jgi:hypothetical protein